MTNGGRVGEFPQDVVGDQRLPLRIVVDKRLDMSLQKIGRNRHLESLSAPRSSPEADNVAFSGHKCSTVTLFIEILPS